MHLIQQFYRFIRRNLLLSFLLGAVLGWSTETMLSFLWQREGARGVSGTVGALVVLILIGSWLRYYVRQRNAKQIVLGAPPRPHSALIWLYSKPEPLAKALAHHQSRLRYLWLIVTPEAEGLTDELDLAKPNLIHFKQITPTAWDPDDTALAVRRAHEHALDLGIAHDEIICDITGGTKTMTIGAIVTCLARDIHTQMVPGIYTENLTGPQPADVIAINLQ